MKIHHIGIVCKNIEKSVADYKKYFNVVEESITVYDAQQKANLCMLKTDTGLDVEFISGEQVAHMAKGITYYHVCYLVENLEEAINDFLNNGAVIVSEPKPAILFGGKRVAFLLIRSGLIELLEE